MSRIDPGRMMEIVGEAMELPAVSRNSFLDSTCGGDPELRREVEDLLECAEPAVQAFDAASDHMIRDDPQQIGPYTIIEQIGAGGMAVVYRAQQHRPVKRIVALKLIKLGMDTRQFVARFEAERQALALMDHPNLARVFDAGSTETGRPYFIMEYVPGRPILEYCDENHLDVPDRLELFMVVCEAVEHAHRKGIIHRDIKNSNVLITEIDGKPIPKVIDFGVAKTIQQPLTDRTLQTEQGQLIGTPEYMSPEQAERGALDIDTRSDVYSLGVLLYELIAGVQPISSDLLRGAGYEQVQRVIRESEPQRPSTRLSTLAGADATRIAHSRRTALPTLIRSLRSELEWIPLKAMRKDREQRYRSAAELADDVRNYLDGRPLIAGPESTGYKLRKFLRRHKTGVAASAAMVLLLLGGIVATSWQAIRATRAEARTAEQRDNARATLEFLTDYVLAGATPEKIPDEKIRNQIISAMITPAAEHVAEALKDRPIIQASVDEVIREVLVKIGRQDLALPHAQRALSIRRRVLGEDHSDTITSLNNYASVLEKLGQAGEAEPLYQQALERSRRVLGEEHPDTVSVLNNYAGLLRSGGRAEQAEPLYRNAYETRRRVQGEDHPDTMTALNNYAAVLEDLDRADEAEPLFRQALDRSRRLLGEDHPMTLGTLNNYAGVLQTLGRASEAEPLYHELLQRRRRVLGEDHPHTISSLNNYAALVRLRGRTDEAESLYKQALASHRRVQGDDHPDTLSVMQNYGAMLLSANRSTDAEPLLRESYERRLRVLGEDHPQTLVAMFNFAMALRAAGRIAEANPLFAQALQRYQRVFGMDHPDTLRATYNVARILAGQGKHAEAEALCADLYRRAPNAKIDAQSAARYVSLYGPCLVKLKRFEEAEQPLRIAYQRLRAAAHSKDPRFIAVLSALAEVCEQTDRPEEAAQWRAELSKLQSATKPATHPA